MHFAGKARQPNLHNMATLTEQAKLLWSDRRDRLLSRQQWGEGNNIIWVMVPSFSTWLLKLTKHKQSFPGAFAGAAECIH